MARSERRLAKRLKKMDSVPAFQDETCRDWKEIAEIAIRLNAITYAEILIEKIELRIADENAQKQRAARETAPIDAGAGPQGIEAHRVPEANEAERVPDPAPVLAKSARRKQGKQPDRQNSSGRSPPPKRPGSARRNQPNVASSP